jgi:hypothetical protein
MVARSTASAVRFSMAATDSISSRRRDASWVSEAALRGSSQREGSLIFVSSSASRARLVSRSKVAQQVCCSGLDLFCARGELAHDLSSVLGALAATATMRV